MESATSGADIIKRLVLHGFVDEVDAAADKRVKRLFITAKGREVMYHIFAQMDVVSDIIGGNLSHVEKALLLGILQKLDGLHQNIYNNLRQEPLPVIKDNLSLM
jgi:DNA-binding MarR family transcriptional regulator